MRRRASHPSLSEDDKQSSHSNELPLMSPQDTNQPSLPRVQRPAPVFYHASRFSIPFQVAPDGQGEEYIEWDIAPPKCHSPTLRALISRSSISDSPTSDPFPSPASTPENPFNCHSNTSDSAHSQPPLHTKESTCFRIEEWKAENFASRSQIFNLVNRYPIPTVIEPIGPVVTQYTKLANRFSHYLLFIALFLGLNLVLLIVVLIVYRNDIFTTNFAYVCATAGTIDLSLAVFMRHENVINLAFYLVTEFTPRSLSVETRSVLAKVPYSLGGIHIGCACSAVLWQTLQTVILAKYHIEHTVKGLDKVLIVLSFLTLAGLWTITITSTPRIRNRFHKQWEFIHRWGGYFTIVTVWPQTFITAIIESKPGDSSARLLIHSPTFWCLILILIPIIYPWIWLRRVSFYFEKNDWSPGSCQLYFKTSAPISPSVAIRMARAPLGEYHGFATIPFPNRESGFAVFMSGLGDWTQEFIRNPPTHVWTRGAPTHGVLRIVPMFRRMVFIATGSGVGPVLSVLNVYDNILDFHLIWVDTNPWERHGPYVTRQVLNFGDRATIVDKAIVGKGLDLVTLGWAAKMAINAEAVAIISGPGATKTVTHAFESRGVPCFGAIFDS